MSKLDDIILRMPGAVLHTDKAGYNTVHRKAVVAKQEIKQLMLELIESTYSSYSDVSEVEMVDKDELRRRVNEL